MSTRGCIARVTGEGQFTGVYHHWDGYPTQLGKTLWDILRGHFAGDLEKMLHFLIDEHPAGWSTINGADFTKRAGFQEIKYGKTRPRRNGPLCYCHGDRHEEASLVDQDTDAGMEWAYVFDAEKRVMYVLERVYTDDAGSGHEIFTGKKIENLAGHHMTGIAGFGAEGHQRWADAARVELDGVEPDWSKISARK
jgi:hypothetical protein